MSGREGAELELATLVQAKAGSERACRALFRLYADRVHAFLWRMLGAKGGPELVEDLTQETFLRVFGALRGFDSSGPARLSSWILTIAHRLALNELRRRGRDRTKLVGSKKTEPDASAAPAAPGSDELGLRLRTALDELPEDQRAVVLLHDLHGLTQDEAAVVLEVPAGTVKSRLSRARSALRRALELEDDQH